MTYEVTIDKLDHFGRGIGRINDKIVFVPFALPNEFVTIQVIKDKSKYYEGKIVKLHNSSDMRINPICPYFGICGGCDLMHISYEEQLRFKENKTIDILYKFGGINKDIIKNIVRSDELYYRNKVVLQVDERIGFYKNNTNEIVNIDKCYISNNNISKIIGIIKDNVFINIDNITIRSSNITNEIMVIFDKIGNIEEDKIISLLKDNITSIIVKEKDNYKVVYGNDCIYEYIGDYKYKISPSSFFQVNTLQAINMYNKVLEYINNDDIVLDLYCGTGTIGMHISNKAKKVIGIEVNKYAVEDAIYNSKINNISNIEFICSDASDFTYSDKIDSVIVDPPRSGLNKKTINNILNIKPKQIIYVSCDPITLGRDLKILSEQYDIIEVTPYDMFPNTHHVECIALLGLKDNIDTTDY